MCHGNWEILALLLQALDDERNDIYLHVDRKANAFPEARIKLCVVNGTLSFVKRMSVNWGGYSQIEAEVNLLTAATRKYHTYYHLISGVDFPLKTQDEVYNFFATNSGKNFIGYDEKAIRLGSHLNRIREYHFFQEKIGRNSGKMAALCWKLEQKSLQIQKHLGVNRVKGRSENFQKGTNWFSITHEMATYVLSKKREIKRNFRWTICADEMFLHTVAWNSPLADTIIDDCLRFVDWKRGAPYIFTREDYDMLLSSDKLFARKFDEKVDFEIVKRLAEHLK